MRRRGVPAGIIALALAIPVAATLASSRAAAAAVIIVTATTDAGPGSLRAAFATASGDGVDSEIVLQNGGDYALTDCAAGALTHTDPHALLLTGNGSTIKQTCLGKRVVDNIGSSGALTIDGVTITGGYIGSTSGGGGIAASSGGLVVRSSTITNKIAGTGGGMFVTGGGSLTVVNSTVTGNTGTDATGVGGLEAQGSITLVYATVVQNEAGGSGNPANVGEPANVRSGGGLSAFGSVVATPFGNTPTNCAIHGTTTSHGYNVSDDLSCGFLGTGDRPGDPHLGELADNGGGTPTMAPSIGGPLVNVIPLAACQADGAAGVTTDQRGSPRPGEEVNGCGHTGPVGCDIGAVELRYFLAVDCAGPPLPAPRFTG